MGTATFSKHFGLTFGMGRPGDYASKYQPNQYKDPKRIAGHQNISMQDSRIPADQDA